ncbi:hypothetical protein MTCD1_03621 [Colwellia marinimaniae]|uniref:Uncharacterized protein n=1 Tax=Colwellia marinimaniae TaxID=1513592 RepID=A0ABQ0N032_9GAMM|nr:hypothetical protein MTCD1_03621 [Colwellia marinimaniae]
MLDLNTLFMLTMIPGSAMLITSIIVGVFESKN